MEEGEEEEEEEVEEDEEEEEGTAAVALKLEMCTQMNPFWIMELHKDLFLVRISLKHRATLEKDISSS